MAHTCMHSNRLWARSRPSIISYRIMACLVFDYFPLSSFPTHRSHPLHILITYITYHRLPLIEEKQNHPSFIIPHFLSTDFGQFDLYCIFSLSSLIFESSHLCQYQRLINAGNCISFFSIHT
jgi:hypothetical protein